MKKGLLFALAFGIGTFAFGQNQTQNVTKASVKRSIDIAVEQESTVNGAPIQTNKSNKGALTGITLGYSNNAYGSIVENQSCLTYNEDLGLLQFTHRAKIGETFTGGTAISSGDIVTSYSTDGGATWGSLFSYPNADAVGNNRYPGGVIYNPTGNTNPMSAYTAYVGPVTVNSLWDKAFCGSRKFDNTEESNSYVPSNLSLIRYGFTSTTDNKIHVVGTANSAEGVTPTVQDTTYILTGTFNDTDHDFDWSIKKISVEYVLEATGDESAYLGYSNMAWSNDGNTGYFWTLGRHPSNDVRSYQPIVYKTTDAGINWVMMPVFDFSTLPLLAEYLSPLNGVTPEAVRPQFYGDVDGVVDANDQLHLISKIRSAYSDVEDELTSYSSWKSGAGSYPIFDFFTTATDWDVVHLGDVFADDVTKEYGEYGDLGWGTRVQAGKTKDGTKIFASWTDTDTIYEIADADDKYINIAPNLYVAGYDIISGKQTNPTNFSAGTSFDGEFFFHYMSDLVMTDNGTYKIPVTNIIKGSVAVDPVTHVYVQGIEFTDADFVTNPGFTKSLDNSISISQNRPNPFTGNTTIDVNLNKASNVSMKVVNITGQTVYAVELGQKPQGTHTIDFNASDIASGIYFYTVTAGTSSITKKMMIK